MCSLAVEDLRASTTASIDARARWWLPATLATVVFAALSIAAGITNVGFLEADGCTHYLYARFALQEPHFLVNVWGRPLHTALYTLPSTHFGLMGARSVSLLLAIVCAFLTAQIARGQGFRYPVLALLFTLGQPLVFLHSFSELTELLFAVLLASAFLVYQRRRWMALAILVSLTPLARPEGFGFLVLGIIALIAHRRAWLIALLPLPLILWNHAGWIVSGRETEWWRWLASNWPYAPNSLYDRGSPFHFIALLPAVVSPFVFPAMVIGVLKSWAAKLDSHRVRCQMLIALIPLLILVGHSLLYATGKLASSGEIRYMLIVAPFWALLAAWGWEWTFSRMNWCAPVAWAAIAVLAAGLANVAFPVIPLAPQPDYLQSQRFVDWYRTSDAARTFPRICTSQILVYYLMDLNPLDSQRSLDSRRELLRDPPPGTVLLWDPMYSRFNADAERSVEYEELIEYGWRPAAIPHPHLKRGWQILFSRPLP